MNKKLKVTIFVLLAFIVLTIAAGYLKNSDIPVLQPAGSIGRQESNLMWFALGLSLIVVIPVYVLLFVFVWRYREGSRKRARYSPEMSSNGLIEAVWWVIPGILITILSVVTWNSSHTLDPYRSLASKAKPLDIQVIAMDWKWLFIYPDQGVASVSQAAFPKDTPVDFHITSDAPMNSFWIPQLGGQIYAMPGMITRLHLMADRTGSFNGSSANISGDGFARMTFKAESMTRKGFDGWISQARASGRRLDISAYRQLAVPGESRVGYYSSVQEGLFDAQVAKYLVPTTIDGNGYHFSPSVGTTHGGVY